MNAPPAPRTDMQAQPPHPDGRAWVLTIPGQNGAPAWEWIHFDLIHTQARMQIENDPLLSEMARQALTGTDESPRLVSDGTTVAGVLPAYARTGDADAFEITYWHFAVTPHRLVTGRRRPIRTLANLWETVQSGHAPASPATLIDRSIAEFAREVRGRLAALAADLDPVEDMLIEGRDASDLGDLGGRLGAVRREATRLKRALAPLARVIHEDADELPDWMVSAEQGAGDRALHGALDDIAALSDRARSLQDELSTRLAEETNRRQPNQTDTRPRPVQRSGCV